jgi:hypothetical protein
MQTDTGIFVITTQEPTLQAQVVPDMFTHSTVIKISILSLTLRQSGWNLRIQRWLIHLGTGIRSNFSHWMTLLL